MSAKDPILFTLVQNRLDHIARQMGWVMVRTASSPIFSQSHDFSCFLGDTDGTLISQADGLPIHTGGGGQALRKLIETFGKTIEDEDVFLLSDPYEAGGNHLPDWVIARPVFCQGRRIGFACNRAHQSDIGGGAAGTYNPEATEIFHEGIRLPPLRLIERGTVRQDLWNLLLLNSRTPDLMDGDLRAMLGATRIGMERLQSLVEDLGLAPALACFEGVLDHGDRIMRSCLAGVPDGRWQGSDVTENDCFEDIRTEINVALEVTGEDITVDFTGTGPQMRGFKNSSIANTMSATYMALAAFFPANLPRNEGTFRSVSLVMPEGSAVNPRPPAPMTMNTVFIAHQIIHAIWQALGSARPDLACAGWGRAIHPISAGHDGARDHDFIMYHWHGMPGAGAVEGRDGFGQIGHLNALGGLTIPNLEDYEQLYPVRYIRQELRCDGGGPGKWRGGTGIEYTVETDNPAVFYFRSEGLGPPSGYGAHDGHAGAGGTLAVEELDGHHHTPPAYGKRQYQRSICRAFSPGGGGWGDPLTRPVDAVLADVRGGLVSPECAASDYGVVVATDGALDAGATQERRLG
ncbi:MAG: hydantoinase B/oxoprolinase family protein [Rhodospirillaceae bacterium]|nr:hydantoinase B/oxoprolinase family protein [Rhodospirillaceae bacterium]MBT7614044.1 hydantoinase B/oxoprolinase family protein [Rhodospirillaceae bacterium]